MFVRLIHDFKTYDDHFRAPYEAKCHACFLNYDYVVKLETNDRDADFIIDNVLQGHGSHQALKLNSFVSSKDNNTQLWKTGRSLKRFFHNATLRQVKWLMRRHGLDLAMYGYSYDIGTYRSKYLTNGENGMCC